MNDRKTITAGARLFDTFLRWNALGAGAVLLLLMLGTVADVILRYVFNAPFRGSLEMTEFAMALIVFFSLAFAGWQGAHIEIDLFDRWLNRPGLRLLPALLALIGAALFFMIAWLVAVEAFASVRQVSNMMKIPYFPFRMAASFGSATFALVLLLQALGNLQRGRAEPGRSRQDLPGKGGEGGAHVA